MNKIYYIADIVKIDNEPVHIYNNCSEKENTLNQNDANTLSHYLYYIAQSNKPFSIFNIKKDNIKKIIDDNISLQTKNIDCCCCFEIIEDENDFKYAKEIYTGLIFPLIEKKDLIIEYNGRLAGCKYFMSNRINFFYSYDLELSMTINPINSNIVRLSNFIYTNNMKVANQNDIDAYLAEFKKKTLFGKETENKKMIDKLTNIVNTNVFKNEVIEKKKVIKIREQQNPITAIMENIDYLLLKLSKIDNKLKEVKQKEYDKLLSNEDSTLTLSPVTIETLKSFEAELEFIINYNQVKNNDIFDILNNMVLEYFNGVKTERSIEDIDKLCELFYKMKNKYSYSKQRKVIELFSILYILEIYENKNDIKLEDLSNSYFNDLLKSILISLNGMIENNVLENNLVIRLDDNITSEYILDLIKQIKFIPKEKDKQKRIGDIHG